MSENEGSVPPGEESPASEGVVDAQANVSATGSNDAVALAPNAKLLDALTAGASPPKSADEGARGDDSDSVSDDSA